MTSKLLAASAIALVSSTPVFAAGFTGPRLELHAGWDNVTGKLSYDDTAFPANNVTTKESTSGIAYGIGLGYDFPIGDTFIAGVEASADLGNNDRCEPVFGSDAGCFKTKRDLAVGLRLGAIINPSALFYVGGSYVNGRAKISYTDAIDPTNNFAFSDNKGGWRLSTGVEYKLSSSAYLKVEYRYTHYSRYKETIGTETYRLGFDRHQVLGGAGFRF